MRLPATIEIAALTLACLGLVVPTSAFAAAGESGQAQPKLQFTDAALGPHNALKGRVVNAQGMAMPATRVVLLQEKGPVAETTTDAQGRFAVENLQQGLYVVVAGDGAAAFRLWPGRLAPPAATEDVLVVSDGQLTRGQGGVYQWISEHFWLTSALIAAAIAVPVATSAHKSASN